MSSISWRSLHNPTRPPPRRSEVIGVRRRVEGVGEAVDIVAAGERDVVEAEVKDGGEGHPVGQECRAGSDEAARDYVVAVGEALAQAQGSQRRTDSRVMVLVNCEGSSDEKRAQQRGYAGNELPEGTSVVGQELEVSIQVERQE